MATLTTTLSLHSIDSSSDELDITVSDSLTIKSPSIGISKATITTTGANHIIVPANADKQTWVFIRHTGEDSNGASITTEVEIEITGDVAVGTLKVGEWCWFPFCGNGGSKGVQLQSSSGEIVVEYGYWSDSTAQ